MLPSTHPHTNRTMIQSRLLLLLLSATIVSFLCLCHCSVAAFTIIADNSRVNGSSGSATTLSCNVKQSLSSQCRLFPRRQSKRQFQNDSRLQTAASSDDNDNRAQDEILGDSSVEFAKHSPQPRRRKKHSVGRYGGRSRKSSDNKPAAAAEATKFPWKTSAAAAAVLLWIFSGDNENSGYSYYSYSYSSTTVRDGDTVRRQENSNFRTNMNDATEQRLLLQRSRDLERRDDEAIDAFVDQSIRSIERMMDESWE